MKIPPHFLMRGFSLLALGCLAGFAPETTEPPDRVEEDWKVVIATPDSEAVGPQITTVMSPTSDPEAAFGTFYLNYRDHPSWQPGGLQINVYGPTTDPAVPPAVIASDSQGSEVCQTEGETITWTQKLSVSGGNLNYSIVDGNSSTWGRFGQGVGTLSVSVPTSASDLSAYKPEYSVDHSGVSWQSNRVTSMTLVAVRYYRGENLLSTDSTPRALVLPPAE